MGIGYESARRLKYLFEIFAVKNDQSQPSHFIYRLSHHITSITTVNFILHCFERKKVKISKTYF